MRKEQERNRYRTAEQVFSEIYQRNRWGGCNGEFCSGPGSTDRRIVSPYVAMVFEQANSYGFRGSRFVDLGCGDFRVGRQLTPLCSSYVGVDVVRTLVTENQGRFGSSNIRFEHLDIADEELPEGEVCFIRQVFQHLSNRQIIKILGKLGGFRYVFITEHYPTDNEEIEPNKDMVHGGDVRVSRNSGVYLSDPPFNLPAESVRLVLEVPGVGVGENGSSGVIRTYLYLPRA